MIDHEIKQFAKAAGVCVVMIVAITVLPMLLLFVGPMLLMMAAMTWLFAEPEERAALTRLKNTVARKISENLK